MKAATNKIVYERVGRAMWGLLSATDIFIHNPFCNESRLTREKQWVISTFTASNGFGRKGVEFFQALGEAYMSGGLEGAIQTAHRYGTTLSIQHWGEFSSQWEKWLKSLRETGLPIHALPNTVPLLMPAADAIDWLTKIDYRRVELSFNYQFQDPRHLIGVLFAGQPGMPVDAYQRQEWLGDSVLGLLVMKYWSKLGVSMHQMGPLVCQTVSNRFFGSIACLLLGSEKYFMSCEANFQSTLGAIVSRLELRDIKPKTWKYGPDLPPLKLSTMTMDDLLPYLLRRAAFERTHGRAPFWTKLGCPKSGGDMMEAIFGAIYEDSGFDYGAVTAVFKRTIQVILDIFFAETLPEPFDVLASAMKRMGCNAWSITCAVRRPILTRSTALMNNQNANVTTVSKRQREEENLEALVTKRLRLTDTAPHKSNHTDQSVSETPASSTLQAPLSSFPTPTLPRPAKHVQVVKMHNHIIAKASGSTVVEAWAAAVQKAIRVVDEHPHYANMNCTCKHIKC